jgi:predicted alpha/beta superfamily hydrolase
MKNLILSLLAIGLSISTLIAQDKGTAVKKSPFTIGETLEFHSETLDETRQLNIYLPFDYDTSATDYPVVYLLDGSEDEDFIHIAGLAQFATFPWIDMMPRSIIVGIANTDRTRDFTYPTTIEEDIENIPTQGGSEKFIEFVKKEVQPLVEKEYRTNGQKTLIGQSLGGLVATEILIKQPELFDNYMIVSPSMWWDNESLLELEPAFTDSAIEKKKVYLAVGNEGEIMIGGAENLRDFLKGFSEEIEFGYQFFEEHNHGDVLHQAAYRGFEWLYGEED